MSDYHIRYPSGHSFDLTGEFAVVNVPSVGRTPVIASADRTTTFLDPRALVTVIETGAVVYSVDLLPSDELTQDVRRSLHSTETTE